MSQFAPLVAGPQPTAHLVIHTECDLETWQSLVRANLSRWTALLNTRRHQEGHRPFNVQIRDLQGQPVEELVDARAAAREAKEWQKSDASRDQIAAQPDADALEELLLPELSTAP